MARGTKMHIKHIPPCLMVGLFCLLLMSYCSASQLHIAFGLENMLHLFLIKETLEIEIHNNCWVSVSGR